MSTDPNVEERRRFYFANLKRGSGFITRELEASKESPDEGSIKVQQNIELGKPDYLYHLGLSNVQYDLSAMFGDVKFVCMGGSAARMESFAHSVIERFNIKIPVGFGLAPIGKTERYSLFKVCFILIFGDNLF